MGKNLDEEWTNWARHNLERECDRTEILQTLLRHGFAAQSIQTVLADYYPDVNLVAAESPSAKGPRVSYKKLAGLRPGSRDRSLRVDKVNTSRLQLYTIDRFLSQQECQGLLSVIDGKLRPSTVTRCNGDHYYRTSETSDLLESDAPIVRHIDERVARCLGIRLAYSEPIQAQKYSVGQEFKAHTDYFEPGTEEFEEYGTKRGQRTWTFMIYLQNTAKGGGTRFVNIDQTFYPHAGMAVVWYNLRADGSPNPDTLHHGMPVDEGTKTIITKWFRAKGKGKIYY